MSNRSYMPRQKPPWWPENENWPPVRRRSSRQHRSIFWRLGCGLVVMAFVSLMILTFLSVLAAALAYGFNLPPNVLVWVIPVGVIILMFALAGLSWLGRSIRRFSVPVNDLLDAAEKVSEGDYSVRVQVQGPAEVRSVARAFNSMAERLQAIDSDRRSMLADITHEMRTPLTVIRGNLEAMLDGIYPADEANLRSLYEEAQILERLVDDLRILALAESGTLALKKEPTDLSDLVEEVAAVFRPQAETGEVDIVVQAANNVPLAVVDPARLHQVLSNLLANALRYAPAHTQVELRYHLSSEGEHILEVEDHGPGIVPDDLPHIFDRFYKSSDSSGMGLGLTIASKLVEAHGGSITAYSQPGRGTTIHISLP